MTVIIIIVGFIIVSGILGAFFSDKNEINYWDDPYFRDANNDLSPHDCHDKH